MELNKRRLLKSIVASSSFFVVNPAEATPKGNGNKRIKENFGIYNNSNEKKNIDINIFNKNLSKESSLSFDLRGRNEPSHVRPEESRYEGRISVRGRPDGNYLFEASTPSGRKASANIRVENGDISRFQVVSVYVRPDKSLNVRSCWR